MSAEKRIKSALQQKREAAGPELERIRQKLIQQRTLRDTTNHPKVELAPSNKKGAIARRLNKANEPRSYGATRNQQISDSGVPDDTSNGADTNGGGGDPGGAV